MGRFVFIFFIGLLQLSLVLAEDSLVPMQSPIALRIVDALPHRINSNLELDTLGKTGVVVPPKVTKTSKIYYYGIVPDSSPQKFIVSIVDHETQTESLFLQLSLKTLSELTQLPQAEIPKIETTAVQVSEMKKINALRLKSEIPRAEVVPQAEIKTNQANDCDVALTFDDGPHPSNTPKLLTFLKEQNVHASFFVLAQMAKAHPEVLKSLVDAKDQANEPLILIGNHSNTHKQLSAILNPKTLSAEITALEEVDAFKSALIQQSGQKYFRCPYGAFNQRVLLALKEEGYDCHTDWDIDPEDWKHRNAITVSDYVIKEVLDICSDPEKRKKGAVVLLHDIHATSVEAAKIIINNLKGKVRFVKINQVNQENTSFIKPKATGHAPGENQ
ncbi:MAG: polysaccharide deacetylase family protein [Bdellovibrionota bacterium]